MELFVLDPEDEKLKMELILVPILLIGIPYLAIFELGKWLDFNAAKC